MKVNVIVLSGYGLNGEQEMAHGFELAGASARIIHLNDVIENPKLLDEAQILAFPGGFSFGDHTGAGKAFANRVRNHLWEPLMNFIQRDTLVIGICNGFQILVQLGILPALSAYGVREGALIRNKSQRYQCEWIEVKTEANSPCIWTKGLTQFPLPIGHGEGNYFMPDEALDALEAANQVALRYVQNPNGAKRDIAGVCDPTGRIFGLMPHPDRSLYFTNLPDWVEKKHELLEKGEALPVEGPGLAIYKNAVSYFLNQ